MGIHGIASFRLQHSHCLVVQWGPGVNSRSISKCSVCPGKEQVESCGLGTGLLDVFHWLQKPRTPYEVCTKSVKLCVSWARGCAIINSLERLSLRKMVPLCCCMLEGCSMVFCFKGTQGWECFWFQGHFELALLLATVRTLPSFYFSAVIGLWHMLPLPWTQILSWASLLWWFRCKWTP